MICALLERTRASSVVDFIGLDSSSDNPELSLWLRRQEAGIDKLKPWIANQIGAEPVHGVLTTVETEFKYAGYIPEDFTYEGIPGLSNEIRQKLGRVRPVTLGQARRIPGVTPAAIAIVDIYLTISASVV